MKDLKLEIDLIPKGAWGSSLSKQLPKADWDILRQYAYSRAKGKCSICGYHTNDLDAHEVWNFDRRNKTQTLKDIVALCTRCHGVKHFRNSERLGYGQNAKRHFMKINNCSELIFANHCFESMLDYEANNDIYRWNTKVDFEKFGGSSDMKIKDNYLPFITDPYQDTDFEKFDISHNQGINFRSSGNGNIPKLYNVEVDNYAGTISLECALTKRVDFYFDKSILKSHYNTGGRFAVEFSLKNRNHPYVRFRLIGYGGIFESEKFELRECI